MAYAGGWQPEPGGTGGNGDAQNNSFSGLNHMNNPNAELFDFQSPLRSVDSWPNFAIGPLLDMSSVTPQFGAHQPMNNGQRVGMYSSVHQAAHDVLSVGTGDRQGHSIYGSMVGRDGPLPPPLATPTRDSGYLGGRGIGAWPSNSMSAASPGAQSYGFGHQSHQNQPSLVHPAQMSAAIMSSGANSLQAASPAPTGNFAASTVLSASDSTHVPNLETPTTMGFSGSAMHVTSANRVGSAPDHQNPLRQVQPGAVPSINVGPGIQSPSALNMNTAHSNFSPQHHQQPSSPTSFYPYNTYLPPPSPNIPQPSFSPVTPSHTAHPPNVNNIQQAPAGFNNSSLGTIFEDPIRQRPNHSSQAQPAVPSIRPGTSSNNSNNNNNNNNHNHHNNNHNNNNHHYRSNNNSHNHNDEDEEDDDDDDQHNPDNNMPASRKRTAATSSTRSGSSSKRRRGPDAGADSSNKRVCLEDDPLAVEAGDAKKQAALDKSDIVDLVDANDVPDAIMKQKEKEKNMQRLSAFQCVICMDDCKNLTVTSCGHLFCGGCLHESLHTSNAKRICPMCRQPIHPQTKTKGKWVALMKVKKIGVKGKQPIRRPAS